MKTRKQQNRAAPSFGVHPPTFNPPPPFAAFAGRAPAWAMHGPPGVELDAPIPFTLAGQAKPIPIPLPLDSQIPFSLDGQVKP